QLGVMVGARVTATVSDERARGQIAALGVQAIEPKGFSDYGPFDVILELVGAINLDENLDALAAGGRIAVIGVGAGASTARRCGRGRSRRRRSPRGWWRRWSCPGSRPATSPCRYAGRSRWSAP